MKPYNVPNLIPAGTVMNANITSKVQQVYNTFVGAIQVVWTGTPSGTFKLQASADPFESSIPGFPSNWSDITGSSEVVSAAGNFMWNIQEPGYNWIQIVYTDASSGSSTAIITSSTANGKGF